jgi:hypothetical protein
MNIRLAYFGRSVAHEAPGAIGRGFEITFAPNLAREPVAFDAALRDPVRFREAMSALHDVVISDLRYKKRDKTAYEEWKKSEAERMREVRRGTYKEAKERILANAEQPVSADIEKEFEAARRKYWHARQEYSSYLLKHDRTVWRMLMPCDPVITVADDVCFFECFSADESAYGCLTVDRAAFGESRIPVKLGTTNVDYSWELYHHFQGMRTYKETRFKIDPEGFTAAIRPAGGAGGGAEDASEYREEKIDLPEGWLRGFMQLQACMALPMTKVTLSREAVYSVLAYLKRHRREASPRALRFELVPGKAPELVLEPWGVRIVSHGTTYSGPSTEPIRIWGRRRLLMLARVLPLAEGIDVYLPGTGLPSFWVVRMGMMRLTVGLSGWTTNDWTRGSAVDLLAPPVEVNETLVRTLAEALQAKRTATLAELQRVAMRDAGESLAALHKLAHRGQVIHDLAAGAGGMYRWRQIMPEALGEAQIGGPHPELAGARGIVVARQAKITKTEAGPGGTTVLTGEAEGKPCELMMDADGRIKRGTCVCSYYHRFSLRNGPCRHMLSLRMLAQNPGLEAPGGWSAAFAKFWSN